MRASGPAVLQTKPCCLRGCAPKGDLHRADQILIVPLNCRKRGGGEGNWAICGFPHQWLLSEFSSLGGNECMTGEGVFRGPSLVPERALGNSTSSFPPRRDQLVSSV